MSGRLYYNGNIITMRAPGETTSALLVRDGKIAAVGGEELLERYATEDRVDLEGKTLLPGFIDGHSHITMACVFTRLSSPPVGDVDSVEKLVAAVGKEIKAHPPKGKKWFFAMGYDNAAFPDGRHPTCKELDAATGSIPAAVLHVSGHVGVLNSAALKAVKVTAATPDPEGGKIGHFADGEPDGLLEEAALTGILRKASLKLIPPLAEIIASAEKAQKLYASNGITTAQDGASSGAVLMFYRWLGARGKLWLDICAYPMLGGGEKSIKGTDSRVIRYKNHVRVAGAKIILDGSPQAKTAWLTEPYFVQPEDKPADYRGYPVHGDEGELLEFFKLCLRNNWQLLAHCNGDAAADQYISVYRRAVEQTGIKSDLRPVMIHAQTLRADQLNAMKELGMTPSFFHDHTYYWGDWHLSSVLGPERGKRISPLREATDRGVPYTLHQDTPVISPNMIFTLHCAVNRLTAGGQPIGQEFAATPYEALRALTADAARQYHEEAIKGSLEPGKLADLVILDGDPLSVPREKIKDIRVVETIKEGKTVFRR